MSAVLFTIGMLDSLDDLTFDQLEDLKSQLELEIKKIAQLKANYIAELSLSKKLSFPADLIERELILLRQFYRVLHKIDIIKMTTSISADLEPIYFDRVIVGAGPTGTAVYQRFREGRGDFDKVIRVDDGEADEKIKTERAYNDKLSGLSCLVLTHPQSTPQFSKDGKGLMG